MPHTQLTLNGALPDPNPQSRLSDTLTRYLGEAITRALGDDDITEIYLNPEDGLVRYDTRSGGKVASGERLSAHRVEMFLNAVAAGTGATLTPESPRLEAELPTTLFRGSRLQGFVPPVTAGPAFNLRKPAALVYTLDDYVAAQSLTPIERALLGEAVAWHRNILVAGGTNSGKTTLANALLHEITQQFPHERLVILEDTVELQCAARDHLALRTSARVTLADLVRSALRTAPNRLIVGEVRGPEALDLLDAWATGHPGGVATVHAGSAQGALLRLDRLAQRANVPPQAALVAEAVHVVVLIEGTNRNRRITQLVEVDGLDAGGYRLRPLAQAAGR